MPGFHPQNRRSPRSRGSHKVARRKPPGTSAKRSASKTRASVRKRFSEQARQWREKVLSLDQIFGRHGKEDLANRHDCSWYKQLVYVYFLRKECSLEEALI